MTDDANGPGEAVALIGLWCRFPGAQTPADFWRLLREGREGITYFTDEELEAAGVDPAAIADPNYVKAAPLIDAVERFDAAYFNYSPREAAMMDPQHRHFLECCVLALEDAGYGDPAGTRVGVYGGAAMNTYVHNIVSRMPRMSSSDWFQTIIGNDKDYLATRVAYQMKLHGPAITVQTACSSSLVAVHLAVQSLLGAECDLALAGGVSVRVPQRAGYFYQEGMVASPDGHCRSFDADAGGTLFGSGVGVVVLKRLGEALRDGDHVYAVIRGSAVNNDGADKIGYTAPGVRGQAEVIAEALSVAGVSPNTIGYVEAHGTGTPLGDPIEVDALNEVFGPRTADSAPCALGSVKSNLGHLDAAAGIAGLIKVALMLRNRELVPSVNFRSPNPRINFAGGRFRVSSALRRWTDGIGDAPRRAGVSSFGIGGTNAHVVIEEAARPAERAARTGWPLQVLPLSARSKTALETLTDRLAGSLAEQPLDLPDVAGTLQVGRAAHEYRRFVVVRDAPEAVHLLRERDPRRVFSYRVESRDRSIAFMFPGGGAQHVGMARDLYQADAGFAADVDRCATLLEPQLGYDLRQILYPGSPGEEHEQRMAQIQAALAALFTIEYALARLWMRGGVRPQSMIGHSIGEYVAACVAGVFSLEDALRVVAARGRLMATVPTGAMLSVALTEQQAARLLDADLSIAALNGTNACVVSGAVAAVERLQARLRAEGVEFRRLHIVIGAHSTLVDPILDEFARVVAALPRSAPQIPFISNVTGTWISAEEATSPAYWSRHLRSTVRFADGLAQLRREANRVLLEVGPGQTLTGIARSAGPGPLIVPSMRHHDTDTSDASFLLESAGKLWLGGVAVDWRGLQGASSPRRIPLPTYPFEGRRHWIDAAPLAHNVGEPVALADEPADGTHPATARGPGAAQARPELMNPYVPPRTALEQSIATVWETTFGIAPIGVHDNFFDLGGTSLLATQLAAALNRTLGVEIATRELLKAPTIGDFALLVDRVRAQQGAALTERLLAEVAALSDDDVRRLLDQKKTANNAAPDSSPDHR